MRVERVREAEQVVLVGAPAVVEDEQAFRLARRRALTKTRALTRSRCYARTPRALDEPGDKAPGSSSFS